MTNIPHMERGQLPQITNIPHMERGQLPIYVKSMDSVDIVHGHLPAGVLEQRSMDNVHGVHGYCPLRTHGQCPLNPWTMSTQSLDFSLGFPDTLFSIELLQSNQTECIHPVHNACYLYFMTYNAFMYMSINTDRHTVSMFISTDRHTVPRPSAKSQTTLFYILYCCNPVYNILKNQHLLVIKELLPNYKIYIGGKLDGVYCFLVYLNIMNN